MLAGRHMYNKLKECELVQYERLGSIASWRVNCCQLDSLSSSEDYEGFVVLAAGSYQGASAGNMFLQRMSQLDGKQLCECLLGEAALSLYLKHRCLVAPFWLKQGRLEWSRQGQGQGEPSVHQ